LDLVDIGVDKGRAALATPEEPAAMSKVFDERLLMRVSGLVVVDEAGDESVKIFEAFALDNESFGAAVVDGCVDAGGEFAGRCDWTRLIRHKVSFSRPV
jgi:hypothetical protein